MTIYANRQENIAAMGGTRTAESMEVSARQWQSEFLNTYLGTEGLRGTLEAGTGAGKTRASIMCMYAWYHMHSDGVVVFYIARTSNATNHYCNALMDAILCSLWWWLQGSNQG